MKKVNSKVLCQMAILTAVYVLLSMTLVIRLANWKLTFVALPWWWPFCCWVPGEPRGGPGG